MSEDKKILIVDDEEALCAAIRELLELKNYTVFEANNGVAGLKICAEQPIDLIILDLNMPRMDGYMFLQHLKERWEKDNRRFKFPQVIVLSAVDFKTDLGLAKNLGATRVMNKPFKSKQLLGVVEEILA